jgi:hypothetical protein
MPTEKSQLEDYDGNKVEIGAYYLSASGKLLRYRGSGGPFGAFPSFISPEDYPNLENIVIDFSGIKSLKRVELTHFIQILNSRLNAVKDYLDSKTP